MSFLDLDFDPAVRDWILHNTGQAVHAQKGRSEVKSNPMPSRKRRDLNLADFHLREKIEYDDKEILLYEDDQGHNYTKTRFNLKKTRDKMLEYPPDEDSNLVLEEDYQERSILFKPEFKQHFDKR